MDFELTKEQRIIQKTIRDFATKELAPKADELDQKEEFPHQIFKRIGELGLLGMLLPPTYGGSDAGELSLALAIEEIAKACASTADIVDSAATNCEFFFEDCPIPAANRLGEEGKGMRIALATLDHGRIGIAAQAVGIAQAVLERCTDYAKTRIQFGSPIAKNQAISIKLADMATEIAAARFLYYHAACLADNGKPFSTNAAMAKLYASELAMRASTAGIQIFGGYGYMIEYPMQRYFRDAKLTELYEGTSEVQRKLLH